MRPEITAATLLAAAAIGATDCQSCHSALRPSGHLLGQCSQCHNTTAWTPTTFTHTFPMTHNGANSVCTICHTTGVAPAYSCWKCHNQAEETTRHASRGVTFPTDCMQCHANGRAP